MKQRNNSNNTNTVNRVRHTISPDAFYLALDISQVSVDNIVYCDTKRNAVFEGGHFTKFIYSDSSMIMNTLYVYLPIDIEYPLLISEPSGILQLMFSPTENANLIHTMSQLEHKLLVHYMSYFGITNKNKTYSVTSFLQKGVIKVVTSANHHVFSSHVKLLMKISGIWETQNAIGLTYKIMEI